jgi:hypothetical protein
MKLRKTLPKSSDCVDMHLDMKEVLRGGYWKQNCGY